jgi:hypothetical protein
MKWTPVESSALQAAAYAESQALLYLLFRSGEVYRYFDVLWRRIPKADISGATFGGSSVTSECAGRGERSRCVEKLLVTEKT